MTTGIISTYASGVDLVVEWKIKNFFNLLVTDGRHYYSPEFSFGGERWFLWILPNGSSRNGSSGHVDLRLIIWDIDRSIRQSFSLSLKTIRGEKYNERHFTKDFDKDNWFHAFNLFIPRSELSRRRSKLVPEGDLTVICMMKSSTSARSASNSGFAEYCTPDSDSAERSSDSDSAECCHKCSNCLDIVKKHKKLFEDLEKQKERSEGETCASGSTTNFQEKKALHDFKELFLKKEECDVTIKVKSLEFPAHRVILKARSPVLDSTFQHDMKESATGVLEIDDCDPSSFSDFLCFLYCADVQLITQKSVFDLFTLADKYQVLDLRSKCLEFMKNNLTVDTFCETITLALRHSETELIKLSTDYFTKNAPKIIVTVKWQTFITENPIEGNELFIKILVPNAN